jgi:hypothetical protein
MRSNLSAYHAYGMNFRDKFRDSHQLRHAAKWFAHIIHIQAGNNDPLSGIGKIIANSHNTFIEKLRFVQADYFAIFGQAVISVDNCTGIERIELSL